MKVFFKTFGCRSNISDTQVMQIGLKELKEYTIIDDDIHADIIIINSCTVTDGADKSVKEYIRKVSRLNKKIIFTGCGLNSVGKKAFENNNIFAAFGHSNKENIKELIQKDSRFFLNNDLSHVDRRIASSFEGRTRAFIKVQEGCNFKCSYCVIPQVRGRARSLLKEDILEQVNILSANNISEIVLSGTNLGSYGVDFKGHYRLPSLIADISKIRGIKRIRLGSLEPSQIREDFLELLGEDFLEKHLHIALQHSTDKMLRIMNRLNRFDRDLELFHRIASYGFALGSDYIVGHPGEDAKTFEEGFNNLKLFPLTHIHAFIYSPRSATPSSSMKIEVSKLEAKKRLKSLQALIKQKNKQFRWEQKSKKMPMKVLVEHKVNVGDNEGKKSGELYSGLDQFFNKIHIKSTRDLRSTWLDIDNYNVCEDINYAEV